MPDNLKKRTITALIWSAVQNWGVKVFTLLLFLVLAKYLNPAEMGVAAVVTLVLAFVAVLSEQGFVDALVQHKGLQYKDLNIPFICSIIVAFICSAILFSCSNQIANLLHAKDAAHLIAIAAVIPPITAASNFQIAMQRRELNFKRLARASIVSTLIAGVLALIMAVQGYGALSLVYQAICTAFITSAILWWKPVWVPSLELSRDSFGSIFSYSSNAFISRLIDFFSTKVLDIIIISKFGLVELGLYTVGSRLYITLLQLLAFTLMDVALAALSKISTDIERLRRAYLKLLFIASCCTVPLFGLLAALSLEINMILFGGKWAGVDKIMMWLFALGAVQVVQVFNGALLSATGNARTILLLNILKFSAGGACVMMIPASSVIEMTRNYVLSQLLLMPVIFGAGMRVLKISTSEVAKQIVPGVAASLFAYLVITIVRPVISSIGLNLIYQLTLLACIFCAVFIVFLMMTSLRQLLNEFKYVRTGFGK
jgi:O-antigen/teichoic acid export membrane protein